MTERRARDGKGWVKTRVPFEDTLRARERKHLWGDWPTDQQRELVELSSAERDALADAIALLRRLTEWDALNPPEQAPAPYGDWATRWKKETDHALARLDGAA